VSASLKVVFIAGAGRSGTTLLNVLLGQLPGFFAVGEMNYIWDAGYGRNQLCACGVQLQACEFWGGIGPVVAGKEGPGAYARFARLREKVGCRSRLLQLSSPVLRIARFREDLTEYRAVTGRLLREIQNRSGSRVIVDSSKDPAHGLVLAGIPGIDLHVVHVIRHPSAVAFSRRNAKLKTSIVGAREHMPTTNVIVSALKWRLVNTLVARIFGSGYRYIRLRYEDLARNPAGEIGRIAGFVGEDPGAMEFIAGHTSSVSPTHTALGNPAKSESGALDITVDDRWRQEMSSLSRWVVSCCTAFAAARYGYTRNDYSDT